MLIPQTVTVFLILVSRISAQGPLSRISQYAFSGFRAKSAESKLATLAELGIDHCTNDNSKVINITDANWRDYLGPQGTGEWLVQFTANPEHCASCELVDLAFNDASHRLAIANPTMKIGRIDCSEEIILSTRFLITKPPIMYHISPAARTVRLLPSELFRPTAIARFYAEDRWRQTTPWTGWFSPLNEGSLPKLMGYIGIVLKTYTHAVDSVPQVSLPPHFNIRRWAGLIIVGVLSSFVMTLLHGHSSDAPASTAVANYAPQ